MDTSAPILSIDLCWGGGGGGGGGGFILPGLLA